MYSIEVKNLTKKFGSFVSVNNISFNVKKGEIFGFLGANGAGKSTTIRMLCGIIEPTSGDGLVAGYSIVKEPDMVKRNIGYMSQRFSLYNDLSVEENINFFGGVYGLSGKLLEERKKWVLNISQLNGKERTLTASLPGGIKQRLALGTAVIHNPGIVFLDEPTSGVDPISRRNFWNLIHDLSSQGTTIFVTTHYLEEAEYCNNIILIDAGNLVAEGGAKELKEKHIKHRIFEVECDPVIDGLEILEKQDFTEDVAVFGNSIHASVNDKFENNDQLINALVKNSVKVKRIQQIIPTLEDVFIHLLENKE
jgi:ABC-2 type transport system ATP-binding protein